MLQPCGYRILVKPDPIELEYGDEFETPTGEKVRIKIATDEKLEAANQVRGTIVAMGPTPWKAFRTLKDGKWVDGTPQAKVGDRVLYSRFAGNGVLDPADTTDEYKMLNDDDIIAIFSEDVTMREWINDNSPEVGRELKRRGAYDAS